MVACYDLGLRKLICFIGLGNTLNKDVYLMQCTNCVLNEDGQNEGISSDLRIVNRQHSIRLNFDMRVS